MLEGDDYPNIIDALMTKMKRQKMEILDSKMMIETLNRLIQSKQTTYRNDDRYIIDFTLSSNPDGYYLRVLSTYSLPDSPQFSVNPFR